MSNLYLVLQFSHEMAWKSKTYIENYSTTEETKNDVWNKDWSPDASVESQRDVLTWLCLFWSHQENSTPGFILRRVLWHFQEMLVLPLF